MELTKKLKASFWDSFLDKYFTPATTVCHNTAGYTFTPSKEFIEELTSSYTAAKIEKFENGPTFSAYHVDYFIGGDKGYAIYKATTHTYPVFVMYDTEEEYNRSFSFND